MYDIMPRTDTTPMNIFHAASIRALGLYLLITIPERTTPMAEKIRPTVPKNIESYLSLEFRCRHVMSGGQKDTSSPVTKLE